MLGLGLSLTSTIRSIAALVRDRVKDVWEFVVGDGSVDIVKSPAPKPYTWNITVGDGSVTFN